MFLSTMGCRYGSSSRTIEIESSVPFTMVVQLARLNHSSIDGGFLNDALGIISSLALWGRILDPLQVMRVIEHRCSVCGEVQES